MSCGETEGAEVAVLTVRPDTTQWTREVKLQAGYEIKGSIAVASDSFIWNGGAPSAQNELSVESNGTYTCRLNAGSNNNCAEAEVSVAVNNIDRRGPEITELTYAGDWTGGGVEVTVKAQDLQEMAIRDAESLKRVTALTGEPPGRRTYIHLRKTVLI